MNLLLDTQIYLWWLAKSPKLSKAANHEIRDADRVFISAASIWEIGIKHAAGKLRIDLGEVMAFDEDGFVELPILARHALAAAALPVHHRDPLDRMLVAQAMTEPMRLLSADRLLKAYSELVVLG